MSEDCAKAITAAPDAPWSGVAGITFTISDRFHRGKWVPLAAATWEGRSYWSIGQGSCADVARLLTGAGCGDLPWAAVDVAGETLFKGRSLHQLAAAAPGKAA
jgi:hypothetical protein